MKQQKKRSQPISSQELSGISTKVFTEKAGVFYIGGQPIDNTIRSILKDEATYILKSRFWELLEATIINESADIALKQSTNWEHVLTAKQLYHWNHVIKNMLHALNK